MKGIFTILAITSVGLTASAAGWGLSGNGTKTDPYLITNADDFMKIGAAVSKTNTGEGEYFAVTADIDFGGTATAPVQLPGIAKAGIVQIANVSWGFEGEIEGNGHTITGIYHTADKNDSAGQFNALISSLGVNGKISNLVFGENNYISTYNYGAPFVSVNKGTVSDCVNYADVTATNAFAAGICGYLVAGTGTIIDCDNHGHIHAMTYAAGIVAGSHSGPAITDYSGYVTENCNNYGETTTTNALGAAGIAGTYSGNLLNCTNYADINDYNASKTTGQYTAGIVATLSYPVSVEGCKNRGNITGNKNVGGIVGMIMKGDGTEFTLSGVTNYGSVHAEGTGTNVAGIVANTMRENGKVTVADCRNSGEVSSTNASADADCVIGNIRGSALIALGEGNSISDLMTIYNLDKGIPTGIDGIVDDNETKTSEIKTMRRGQIVIINDEKQYNATGISL